MSLAAAAGAGLLAFALYGTALSGLFVYDDLRYVRDNRFVQDPRNVARLWTTPYPADRPELGLYRPVTATSYLVDFSVHGVSPRGFHVTNVALHAGASALAVLAVLQLGASIPAAATAGALFAVHPVHTEAVSWIVGRAELLAAIGCLGAALAWGRFRRSSLPIPFALAVTFYFLALGAKETAAPLPLVLLLGEALGLVPGSPPREGGPGTSGARAPSDGRAPVADRARRAWLPYAGFLVAFGLYAALRVNAIGRFSMLEATTAFVGLPAGTQWLTAIAVVGEYIRLCLLPINLRVDYSDFVFTGLGQGPVLVGLLAVASLLAIGWAARRRAPAATFWVGWFLLFVLVFSNLVLPIGAIVAERFVYIASLAPCVLAGTAFARILEPGRSRAVRGAGVTLLLAVLVTMAGLTVQRNGDWQNPIRLFAAEVQRSPRSEKAHVNLAVALWELGKATRSEAVLDQAAEVFRQGIALWPAAQRTLTGDHLRLAYLYANLLQERGRQEEALPLYQQVAQWLETYPALRPDVGPDFHVWFGAALEARGDLDAARAQYERALALKPGWVIPLRNIAQVLMAQGRLEGSVDAYRRALAADPAFTLGYVNLALCLARMSRSDEALAVLQEFRRTAPGSPENAYYQGFLAEKLGRVDEAGQSYAHALELDPGRADARKALEALSRTPRQ